MILRRRRLLLVIAAVVVVLAGGVIAVLVTRHSTTTPAPAAGDATWLSPTGGGSACTRDAPCKDLDTAVAKLPQGGAVYLLGGTYGDQTVAAKESASKRTATVTVTPAPGVTDAVLAGVRLNAPAVVLKQVRGTGVIYFDRGAVGSQLIDSHLEGSGDESSTTPWGPSVIVRADRVLVQGNTVQNSHIHDGINVAGYPTAISGVRIVGNTVHGFSGGSSRQEHPDCLQIFDVADMQVLNNTLYNCYNSAITLSPGSRKGINQVLIQGNFLEGCLPAEMKCGHGGSVVDMRVDQAHSVIVNHNTMINGSSRLSGGNGVVATNNIVGYLSISTCATSLTNSLVGGYSKALCKTGLPGDNNVMGTVDFADEADGNLTPKSAVPAPRPTGSPVTDRMGNVLTVVGAVQP